MFIRKISTILALFFVSLSARVEYVEQSLISMGSDAGSVGTPVVNFGGTDTIRQSFVITPADPLADSVRLHYLLLKSYFWAGTGSSFTLRVREGTTAAPGAEIYRNPLNRKLDPGHSTFDGTSMIAAPSGVTYHQFAEFKVVDTTGVSGVVEPEDTILDIYTGLKLKVGTEYCFELIADSIVERTFGFYQSSTPYRDGSVEKVGVNVPNSESLWFRVCGTAISRMHKTTVCSDFRNRFLLDTCGHFFADKMVGTKTTEYLRIPGATQLVPELQDGSIVSVGQSVVGDSLILELTGIAEGKTNLFLLKGVDTVGMIRVTVTNRKYLDLSFTYINFPGETDHPLRTPAWAVAITDSISKLYDGINVKLNWKQNGNREIAWDFDTDGTSYESDGRERWSPMDSSIIPNQRKCYSNLFLIRNKIALEGFDGNGGGSSRGFGGNDTALSRGAYKAINVNYANGVYCGHTVAACASTLAHELGHNLGLGHCTRYNSMHYPVAYDYRNIMKTGRSEERFFASQWDVVHQEIKLAMARGESYPNTDSGVVAILNRGAVARAAAVLSHNPVAPNISHVTITFPSGTARVKLAIFDVAGNRLFTSDTESPHIVWDLTNQQGIRVSGSCQAIAKITMNDGSVKSWQSLIGVMK